MPLARAAGLRLYFTAQMWVIFCKLLFTIKPFFKTILYYWGIFFLHICEQPPGVTSGWAESIGLLPTVSLEWLPNYSMLFLVSSNPGTIFSGKQIHIYMWWRSSCHISTFRIVESVWLHLGGCLVSYALIYFNFIGLEFKALDLDSLVHMLNRDCFMFTNEFHFHGGLWWTLHFFIILYNFFNFKVLI